MAEPRSDYARLKPEFVGNYFRDKGVSRDDCIAFCRKHREPRLSINEREWRPLLDGKPVRSDLVFAFTEYLTEVARVGRFTFNQIAEFTEPPPPPGLPGTNTWSGGFITALARRAAALAASPSAHSRTVADVDFAARTVVGNVGRRHASASLTEEAAVSNGERIMGRTVADYSRRLQAWWEKVPRSVMFGICRKRQPHRRTGVAVCVPITQAFYDRMAVGAAGDMDITPADVQYPSAWVHINAVAEINAPKPGQLFAYGAAVLHTGLYQLAMLTPELWRTDSCPSLVAFGGTPANEQRVVESGFTATGATLPNTAKRVFTLAADRGKICNLQYWALYGLIRHYQSGLIEERAEVDTPQ